MRKLKITKEKVHFALHETVKYPKKSVLFDTLPTSDKKISRIILVDPKAPSSPKLTGFNEFIEPMGLCCITSFLKERGYDVKIIQQRNKTDKEILQVISDSKPDIVGFTAVTCIYPRAKRFSKELRKKGIPTVVGGSHATADPTGCCRDFDYAVVGEGEATLLELLDNLNKNKGIDGIKGLAFYSKSAKKCIINGRRERLDFKTQPMPSRNGLDISLYKKSFYIPPAPPGIKNKATVLSSKGCPYDCSFCTNKLMWEKRVSAKPTENVLDEVEMLNRKYDVNHVWFQDETFTFSKKRIKKFSEGILKRKLDIHWGCMGRIGSVDRKTLRLMKESGCQYIAYGIESGNPEILKLLDKRITIDSIETTVKETFDAGIVPRAFFIIGLPYETEETLKATKELAIKIWVLSYRFGIFYPFIGTKEREFVDKNSLWLPGQKKLTDATTLRVVVKAGVDRERILKYSEEILSDIYSSKEYQKRKSDFIKQNPLYEKSWDKWKEYQEAISR